MERRIDELDGRFVATNDKLSNQFNHDKLKFKEETEFEFAQHKRSTDSALEQMRHLQIMVFLAGKSS